MPCPSFSIVYLQIDIIEFTGPGVWSVSDKYQFADKRQFHPTKHLSWWVLKLEAEWCSTPSIFRLTDIFDFFVPGSPASSKMATGAMPKHTYGQLSKRSRNLHENSFSVPVSVGISKWPSLSVKSSFLTSVNERRLRWRTRNFRCPALHFLSFIDKLT